MRDITQEYSSLTEYAVRVLDIIVIFALAHSAALLRLSVPLNTLSNSHALPHNDLYKDKLIMYMQRHRVKPGITGWAQINGFRGETDTREKMARRVAYDLHYIKHWSFWMDLKIILWTAFKGWTDRNAF
jgi:hypothetical protein